MIITKIRQETNGIAIPFMSIKINITKIYVQELLKSTGMLNLLMKLTSDLKITELFPIEITKTLTWETEAIWDKKDLKVNLKNNNAVLVFKRIGCLFEAKTTLENKIPGMNMKDLIEMGLIKFSRARWLVNLTNFLRSGIMILAKHVDHVQDPHPQLISITKI